MINKELLNTMKLESSEELFYFFKYDGSIDFEKKLIAGVILSARNFNKHALKNEKKKLIDLYRENSTYISKDTIREKHTKKLRKKILIGIIAAFIATIIALIGLYDGNNINFQWRDITITYLLFTVPPIIQIILFNRRLNSKVNEEFKDQELNRKRLDLIDKYWKF